MPYTGFAKTNEGYLIDIFRVIFEKNGYIVEAKSIPWSRAVIETERGTYDAIAGAYRTDVPGFVLPDIEQGIGIDMFFTLKESTWTFTGISSLEFVTLGVVKDYSYGREIDTYIKKNIHDVSRINSLPGDDNLLHRMLNLLRHGRIGAFIENKDVLYFVFDTNEILDIREAGTRGSDNIYIAFSPNNPKSKEYAKILSDGLRHLRQSGELAVILKKYSLNDWRK